MNAPEGEPYIALNLAFDEAVDDQPAKSIMIIVDYDGDRDLANYTRQIANERWTREPNWYWGHAEEVLDVRPPVGGNWLYQSS
jgi:hypothetical protein